VSHAPITQAIAQHAREHPEKTAVIVEAVGRPARLLTYGELLRHIEAGGGGGSEDSGADHHANNVSNHSVVRDRADGHPLFDAMTDPHDQVLTALLRLGNGEPIVGTTSGSTGQAKRYSRSQDSWVASFDMDRQTFGLQSTDVIVAPGSLSHSLFSYALCHGLYIGATVVLSERFRPDQVLEQIKRYDATVLYGVPTHLKLIAQAASDTPYPSMRWALSSGARWFADIAVKLQSMFPSAVIAEFYGASELSFVSVAFHGGAEPTPPGSVGRPMPGVNVSLENDQIWIHSPGLFDRYLGASPPDFFERVDAQGQRWCSVGDLGRLDSDGYLYLSGRQSRKIIVSAKNLYPEEVEQALLTLPGVAHAAVFGVDDALRGERLIAVVAANSPLGRSQLIAHLRPVLDDYKIPREFFQLNDWPMTASGKTDFAAVRSAVLAGQCLPL